MSKKDKLRILDYLTHILEAIQRINHYTDDVDELTFFSNTLIQDGVIRNFEIIGEASRNIERHHPEFSQIYPELPLGIAYEMRNALAHGYFKVDLTIIWKTIEKDLPELEQKIQEVYKQIEHKQVK